MMGTDNPTEFGLIPRICFGLFECKDINNLFHFFSFQFFFISIIYFHSFIFLDFEGIEQDNEHQCTIDFSYLEIYNETLRYFSSYTSSYYLLLLVIIFLTIFIIVIV